MVFGTVSQNIRHESAVVVVSTINLRSDAGALQVNIRTSPSHEDPAGRVVIVLIVVADGSFLTLSDGDVIGVVFNVVVRQLWPSSSRRKKCQLGLLVMLALAFTVFKPHTLSLSFH